VRRIGPALLLVILSAALVAAHGTHDARLAKVNDQLREDPTDIDRLSERAALLIRHGDFATALADCDVMARHHPDRVVVHGLRARAYLGMDDLDRALVASSRWVDSDPDCAEARRLRSRVLTRLSRFGEAATELGGAVLLDPTPSPDDLLALARLRVGAAGTGTPDGVSWAVDTLDEGCARLGPLPALHLESIHILREAGRYTDAIARTYGLANDRIPPSLLTLRGDLLRDADRIPEAMVAYSDALSAIDGLYGARRHSPALERLHRRVSDELEVLENRLDESARSGSADK
jgi:tetratricopeptide (TPR) repeat protein